MHSPRALGVLLLMAAVAWPSAARADGFDHVGTFDVPDNLRSGEPADTVTSAEILDWTKGSDGLVYTDSPRGRLGFIDARRASAPQPAGAIDVGGEPTSVVTVDRIALVVVNTSADPDGDGPLNDFDAPSGQLLAVDTQTRRVVGRLPLAGQPDSIALSPSKRYAAVVIENERDEDENDGLIPQSPPGSLQVVDLAKILRGDTRGALRTVSLTGLADIAPADPEPEYVDINDRDQAVVSLQENNHLAVVDLPSARVVRDFSAGSATVADVDATEEELGPQGAGLLSYTEKITRRREPDAVHWIDDDTFATANEGDYTDAAGVEGGSRGFTLFDTRGRVEYESGSALEHEAARVGHYPESRSANKGIEPEGLEVGHFGGRTLLFVGAERADVVGVYDVTNGRPRFLQILPTGIGPEGLRVDEQRGLLAVSAETDGKADGFDVRSLVTLYRLRGGRPQYPYIESADERRGVPVPWVALSGLAAGPRSEDRLWAVSDSALAQASIYPIDASRRPAVIERRIPVGGVGVTDQRLGDFDLEGIARRPEGGFWLASEGRSASGSSRPNLIVRADDRGRVKQSIPLPPELAARATNMGLEGVAVTGSAHSGDETVYVAFQRPWSDDPAGFTKLGRYRVAQKRWEFVRYPLDASSNGGTVGLSEITIRPGARRANVIERDDRIARDARIKRVYEVDLRGARWRSYGQPLDVVQKRLARDLLPDLRERSISTPDKLEGLALTRSGRAYFATDNDAVDENYGETVFGALNRLRR